MAPAIVERKVLLRGHVSVERLRIRLPQGDELERDVETHGDAVAVLPYDATRRFALVVRLFRAPAFLTSGEEQLEEVCAGMIDDGDGAEETVRREAMEEMGLEVGEMEFVAKVWSSPGVSTETAALYLTQYEPSDRTGAGGGLASEHEHITVVERPLAELSAEADSGGIVDAKLLMLVLSLRLRRPDLFA